MEADLIDQGARARFHLPPDAVVTGVSALHLLGIDIGAPLPLRAATATRAQTRRAGVRLCWVGRLPDHADRIARPCSAWRDAAGDLDLVELVAAGDALVHAGLASTDELQATAAGASGRHVRVLRRAAGLVRERVDSIQQTRLRLCLVLTGLPEPRCNAVAGHAGRVIGRVDLLVEEFGLILENDGDQHRDRGQWNADLDRDDAFATAGFVTFWVTRDRMRRPRQLVRRVHARLDELGYAGPPPCFDHEWVRLFERRV